MIQNFSIDDLSLPDPLPSPFHTARIGWSSSIPCKFCTFPAFTLILNVSNNNVSISAKLSRVQDSPGLIVTDESGKEAPGFVPPHPETSSGKDDAAPWRRPASVRSRPTNR